MRTVEVLPDPSLGPLGIPTERELFILREKKEPVFRAVLLRDGEVTELGPAEAEEAAAPAPAPAEQLEGDEDDLSDTGPEGYGTSDPA